jgi:hypothetical protein
MMGVRQLIVLAYCVVATTSQTAFLQSRPVNTTANTTANTATYGAYGSTASACPSDHRRIYIIRHAERRDGYSCLNECGWDRAAHLVGLFGRDANGWSSPDEIYAFNYEYSTWSTSCQRCQETVELLGKNLDLPVQYAEDKSLPGVPGCSTTGEVACAQDKAAAQLLHDQIQHVSTIMVAWEHMNLGYLVNFLIGEVPEQIKDWSDSNYDSVVDIRYAKGSDGVYHHCEIQVLSQGYNPLPNHGAHSATSCPACHGGSSRRRVGCPAPQ